MHHLNCYQPMSFKVIYPKGIRLIISNKTFREAMEMVWLSNIANHLEPLKMILSDTGKMLYMDKNLHRSFLCGDITQKELIELTEIDELYRNRIEIISNEQITVDAGSLWKCKDQTLILIDDDQNVTYNLNFDTFEQAEPNL